MKSHHIYGELQRAAALGVGYVGATGNQQLQQALLMAASKIYTDLMIVVEVPSTIEPAVNELTSAVFTDTFINCPEALPGLYPLFALLCGDARGAEGIPSWASATDWKVFKTGR